MPQKGDVDAARTPLASTAGHAAFESEDSSVLLPGGAALKAYQPQTGRVAQFLRRVGATCGCLGDLQSDSSSHGPHTERWCPEEEANWLSRLFFAFANSLVHKGARKHLEQTDLWDTAHQDDPARLWGAFEQQLQATTQPAAPQGVVWKALCRVHAHVFAVTGFIKVGHDIVMFAQPYILEQLLHHLTTAADRWVALGLAGALLVAALLEALMVNIYFHMLFRMSLHTKTQLLEMLYRKSLRVSSAVKSTMGVGPIVNLQSNDAAKLWAMPTYLHMVWNGPFQIIVVMAMLVRVLTVWPALAGLAVTVLIIPLTMLLGKLLTVARKESVAAADQRIKLVTEVITGIKAIKLYAWEEPYVDRITALRERELAAIRRTQMLSMINNSIFNTGPVLVSLAAFGTYAALGHPLTAAVAFPSLALFNLLRFPIVMIPQQIMNLIAATVGIARIQKFMDAEEMAGVRHLSSSSSKHSSSCRSKDGSSHSKRDGSMNGTAAAAAAADDDTSDDVRHDLRGEVQPPAVIINNGSFAWDAAAPAVLRDVRLEVPQGALVIVVGPVGSGKSSLLSAVLGEMVSVEGGVHTPVAPVTVAGSVAYTAQDPWIQNATLRNNVLMGLPHEVGRYQRCVDAACLAADLPMLPAGDASEIGEKGINLSGGQKHRVALARAVYAAADVYLLDDPLSAVDVHVGRHIFEQCICGELAGKTRLLVTHQLQYLPHADLVVVMLDGAIAHTGTYQQLITQGVDLAAFVPLERSGEKEGGETGQQQQAGMPGSNGAQQQQQQGQIRNSTPLTSPRAAAANTADETSRSGSSSRPPAGLDRHHGRSFSGVVVELPRSLTPTVSFASHKPVKFDQEFLRAAGAADDGGGSTGGLAAAVTAKSPRLAGGSSQPQLETIFGPDDLDLGNLGAVDVAETADKAAAAVVEVTVTAHDEVQGAHHTDSDDEDHHEGTSLMQGKQNSSVHGRHQQQLPLQREGSERAVKADGRGRGGQQQGKAAAAAAAAAGEGEKMKKGQLVKAEERAKGQVKRSVYMAYLSAWGPLLLLPIAVTLGALMERGLQVLQNYVLSLWSNHTSQVQQATAEPLAGQDTRFYLLLYFVLGLSSVGVVLLRSAVLVVGSVAASRRLHAKLLAKLVRLPMSFFDAQPTGRLINRFTKDTEALDIQMAAAVNSAMTCLVNALLSIIVVVVVSPYTTLALIPLGFLYYRVQRLYIGTSRELKRLDALAFSPIFQHYGESLSGLATIRAFGRQQLFADTNRTHIEQSNRAWWPIQLLNRWLSMRLELTGAVVVFICAVAVGVLAPRNAGLAGLALTSALNLTGTLAWMVRQTTELEVNMNSVERLIEYRTLPEEAPAIAHPRPAPSWPEAGAVQAVQLVVRYRPELPPVLKGLNFSVNAREKVGICGRTGCGKSTLMMVLFRMVEPSGGVILIDGLDSSRLGLTDLRSRLSLVPQDPVIFSGSVRSNLDPFDQAGSDAAIWEALRQAGIDGLVKSLGAGLDSPIQEGGNNLSSGQRQLLCMARALLRSSRILVLDEATSNVDQASDALIQRTIRSAFAHCTVLTIAHRLHTIADADRVMVLDQGQLREFDSPGRLMQLPGGVFRGLMEEASRQHGAPVSM